VRKRDAGTSSFYYANVISRASSWTMPPDWVEPPPPSTTTQADNWREVLDDKSGNMYYVNMLTMERCAVLLHCLTKQLDIIPLFFFFQGRGSNPSPVQPPAARMRPWWPKPSRHWSFASSLISTPTHQRIFTPPMKISKPTP